MKKTLFALALLGGLTLGFAEDVVVDDTTSVDAQITEIQNAPEQERVQLMNQFKLRVMNMNQAQQDAAISKLQTRMQTKTAEHQMQDSQEMLKVQNMNQHRTANQFQQQMQTSPSSGGSMQHMMGGR